MNRCDGCDIKDHCGGFGARFCWQEVLLLSVAGLFSIGITGLIILGAVDVVAIVRGWL